MQADITKWFWWLLGEWVNKMNILCDRKIQPYLWRDVWNQKSCWGILFPLVYLKWLCCLTNNFQSYCFVMFYCKTCRHVKQILWLLINNWCGSYFLVKLKMNKTTIICCVSGYEILCSEPLQIKIIMQYTANCQGNIPPAMLTVQVNKQTYLQWKNMNSV